MAMVDCPACGKRTRYAPDNPSRPFCSPHCKAIDLGAWATDSYVISGKATDNTTDESTPFEDQPPRRTDP